jgi:DNA modification methylase
MPIYKEDVFNEVWEGRATLRNENGKYYIVYSEEEWALENIEFENVGLLYKQILTFDEFNIVNEFYSKLMESDNEYLLNNNLIIKFNCI